MASASPATAGYDAPLLVLPLVMLADDAAVAPATPAASPARALADLRDAARANDYRAFEAALARANALATSQPMGEAHGAFLRDLAAYRDLAKIWKYAETDRVGAYFDDESLPGFREHLLKDYRGYEAFIAPNRFIDRRGYVFYPTSETRAFLARQAEGHGVAAAETKSTAEPKTPAASPAPAAPRVSKRVVLQKAEAPVVKPAAVVAEHVPTPAPRQPSVATKQAPVVTKPAAVAPAKPAPAPVQQTAAAPIPQSTKQVPTTTPVAKTAVAASSPVTTAPAAHESAAPATVPPQVAEKTADPLANDIHNAAAADTPAAESTKPEVKPAAAKPVQASTADTNATSGGGIFFIILALVVLGVFMTMLRTPESQPMSILPPAATTDAKPEVLEAPQHSEVVPLKKVR